MTNSNCPVKVFRTLGPSSIDFTTIRRLEQRGVDLFRINLSHTPLRLVEATIETIRAASTVPICLDTEGAQVRTGSMEVGITVSETERVQSVRDEVVGTEERLTLTLASVCEELRPRNLVGLDFDGVVLVVLSVAEGSAKTIVLNGSQVGSNKAAVVTPAPPPPATLAERPPSGCNWREAWLISLRPFVC